MDEVGMDGCTFACRSKKSPLIRACATYCHVLVKWHATYSCFRYRTLQRPRLKSWKSSWALKPVKSRPRLLFHLASTSIRRLRLTFDLLISSLISRRRLIFDLSSTSSYVDVDLFCTRMSVPPQRCQGTPWMSTYFDLSDLYIGLRSTYPSWTIDRCQRKAKKDLQHFNRG